MKIGEGFDDIMLNIARDHLCNIDTKKSISIFTEGLGMPTDMAIQVIKGELGLKTNVDNQTVETCTTKCDNWFENEFKNIVKNKIIKLVEDFVYCHKELIKILSKLVYDKIGENDQQIWIEGRYIDINNEKISINSPVQSEIKKALKLISEINQYNNLCIFGLKYNEDILIPFLNSSMNVYNAYNDINIGREVLMHTRDWNIENMNDMDIELSLSVQHINNYNYYTSKNYIGGNNQKESLINLEQYFEIINKLEERDLSIPVHKYMDK